MNKIDINRPFQDYYDTEGVREICHAVKQSKNKAAQKEAIKAIADYLIENYELDQNSMFIPAPNHTGKAEYTKEIAKMIAKKCGGKICDIVRCTPHLSNYLQKQRKAKTVTEYFLIKEYPRRGNLFFVDNVVATGETFMAVNSLFDNKLTLLVYAVDYRALKEQSIITKFAPAQRKEKNGTEEEKDRTKKFKGTV